MLHSAPDRHGSVMARSFGCARKKVLTCQTLPAPRRAVKPCGTSFAGAARHRKEGPMTARLTNAKLDQISRDLAEMFGPTAAHDPTERLDFLTRTVSILLMEVRRGRCNECAKAAESERRSACTCATP
jgi:hypothetical protein